MTNGRGSCVEYWRSAGAALRIVIFNVTQYSFPQITTGCCFHHVRQPDALIEIEFLREIKHAHT